MVEFLLPGLVPLIAMLSVLVIAVTYMGARVFRIPSWEAYFNVEMTNLMMAILTIGMMYGAFMATTQITKMFLPSNYQNLGPVGVSKLFLNSVINEGVLPMYKDLLTIEAMTSLSNSFMIRVGPSVWSSVSKVEPGADAILSITRMLSFGLLAIYGSLSIQYIGLSLMDSMMSLILSLGVLLYIFPTTRDAGAFLIALAFAAGVVFPFIYALNFMALGNIPDFQEWYARGLPTMLAKIGASFGSIVNFEFFVPFINAMARLAMVALFIPAIAMTLTVAMINSITKFLMGKI
ncbi:MAG: hypothetical protein PHS02_00835 [Candidatus ainarchaeum sp.]|nr:hypothetical protein [Candidatus ainarchaeum sp.]